MLRDTIIELTYIDYNAHKMMLALSKLKTSAKSVQTTRVVSSNFSRSLYRLQLKSPESITYLQIYVRVLTEVSTRKYLSVYVYL